MNSMQLSNTPKIACIGAGNVGATAAQYCLELELGNVTLTDIVEGLPQGKALDMTEAGPIRGYSVACTGTNDYADIAGADLVIITAGLPRKPGMTRLDLLEKNGAIIAGICDSIKQYAPDAVVIMVTNPLDVMVYLARQKLGFAKNRVLGMAGCLDSARMRAFVAMELNVSMKNVDTMVLGSHGDAMVPLARYTTVSGIPITQLLSPERIEAINARTRDGGGEIVRLLKTGSAYYAPAAGATRMAQAILRNERQVLPCAALLEGEYGLHDVYMGVPCILGRQGVEAIIELELTDAEREALRRSADEVREGMDGLRQLGLL